VHIPFNKPYLTGKETTYIQQAVASCKISGDGHFTNRCHKFFEQRFGFKKVLLTTSCTDALEMAALLINITPDDEVIMTGYTFVSTANAFVLRGAKIIFADCEATTPNLDADGIEKLITPKTKAIVAVHYAGIACDMDTICEIAEKYGLFVIEDAAQAIDSYYKGKPLGSLGHLSAFSFHETKNVISGEGGMLVINDEQFINRAEVIREKGTNRAAFFRGEIDKYGWVDVGSSFLPSDIIAAFLFAQLECLDQIQTRRLWLWKLYNDGLKPLEFEGYIQRPVVPVYATNNAHMYYFVCIDPNVRSRLITELKINEVHAIFHYQPLHTSPFYKSKHDGRELPNVDRFSDCLIRLPLFYELEEEHVNKVVKLIANFFRGSESGRQD